LFSLALAVPVVVGSCSDDRPSNDDLNTEETGNGDGDGETAGDGDGDTVGDGDGDTAGDGDGDGDGDTGGDGDGDTAGDGDGDTAGDGDGDLTGDDYDKPGPYGVTSTPGQMQVNAQCNLAYAIFEPATLASDIPVFLAHGFMRSIADMAETAEHIASWGVRVYTVPLCTNNALGGVNHQLNGDAIAALGEALAPGGAVYSGFSAGGLATFVAAAGASNAVAFVGLDPVDADLALGLAGQINVPVRGAIAEPGQCNTNNNFLPVFSAIAGAAVLRIVGAQHFDFETAACGGLLDFACSLCAPAGPATRALALGMSTAAILVETGADPGGLSWWEPGGSYFDMYVQQGRITLIQ